MTQQNPLDVLRQFSPSASGITNQFSAGQGITSARLANQQAAAINPLLLQQQELSNQTNQFNLDQAQQGVTANEEALKSQQNIQNTVSNLVRLNTAMDQNATPEQLAAMLQQNIQNTPPGGNAADSQEALQVLQTQGVEGLRNLAGQATAVFKQQGIIQPPPKASSTTASQKDFETFKQLTARAERTKDPIDMQLAEQFGRQSGFDRETPQELANIDVQKTSKVALVKQAATASKEAFDSLKGVRLTISNMSDAITQISNGAETGPVVSKLPSFRQASIELDNIKGRMGLDVVSATTFGALSASELQFALDTALPDSLQPEALKDWLTRKIDAQTKLANELRKAASFLGTPSNTIADYIAKQEKENPSAQNLSDDELFN